MLAPWYLGSTGELFAAVAATAGSLTGLLFVALSVTPRRGPAAGPPAIQQVRVAAALLAFTNAMAVSLFSLVPGTSPGYPAVVLGVIGILFTAAGSGLSCPARPRNASSGSSWGWSCCSC